MPQVFSQQRPTPQGLAAPRDAEPRHAEPRHAEPQPTTSTRASAGRSADDVPPAVDRDADPTSPSDRVGPGQTRTFGASGVMAAIDRSRPLRVAATIAFVAFVVLLLLLFLGSFTSFRVL